MTTIDSINIYTLELKIDKLKAISKKLEEEINSIISEMDYNYGLYTLTKDEMYKEKNDELKKELTGLRLRQGSLENNINKKIIKLKVLKTDESLKDDEIALVNDSDSIEGKYNIYNISLEKKVGYISYFPSYFETEIGSIGYEVYKSFRGNHYAYRSLKMLSGYLSKNGVEKLSIVADVNNVNSISVMEKFKDDAKETVNESENYKALKKYTYSIK